MLKKIIACAAGLFIIAAAYGIFANNIDDETTVNGEHLGENFLSHDGILCKDFRMLHHLRRCHMVF